MIIPWDQSGAVDVSVCVVNWNGREILRELLESIEAEGGDAAVETVIVDNASTDGSIEMIAERFPWARLIVNSQNAGFSKANNQAAAASRGRHLFFLNNDTRVDPGAIATLSRYLDDHPQVSCVGPKTFTQRGAYHFSCRTLPTWPVLLQRLRLFGWLRLFPRFHNRYTMTHIDRERDQSVQQMDGAALMIPRAVIEKIGGWDEGFTFGLEDVDLCARLADHGPLMYVPQASILHHGSISSASNNIYRLRHFEFGYARYLAKHGRTRLAAPAYKLLVTLDQMVIPLMLVTHVIKCIDYRRRGRHDLLKKRWDWVRLNLIYFWGELPRYWRVSGPRRSRKKAKSEHREPQSLPPAKVQPKESNI